MQELSIVLTTSAGEDQAQPIIDALLEQRLAACVQALPVRSHYIWEGAVRHDIETLLIIKCKSENYKAIEETILQLHSYDLPEIVRIPIADGLDRYLDWIASPG